MHLSLTFTHPHKNLFLIVSSSNIYRSLPYPHILNLLSFFDSCTLWSSTHCPFLDGVYFWTSCDVQAKMYNMNNFIIWAPLFFSSSSPFLFISFFLSDNHRKRSKNVYNSQLHTDIQIHLQPFSTNSNEPHCWEVMQMQASWVIHFFSAILWDWKDDNAGEQCALFSNN